MLQFAVAAGVAYFLLRGASRREDNSQEDENLPDPGGIPIPDRPPVDGDADGDGIVEFEPLTRWSGEASVDDQVVWKYTTGIRREDGSEVFDQPYVVIGNGSHTSFLRSNSNAGTIDIPKERTGGDQDMDNVRVFASIADAEEYLNREEEPTSPTDPQREPEDDDSTPTQPSLPTQPGYGLGGGGMTPFQNGGI